MSDETIRPVEIECRPGVPHYTIEIGPTAVADLARMLAPTSVPHTVPAEPEPLQ